MNGLLIYAQAHEYSAKISGYPCNSSFLPKICGVDINQLTTLPILPWGWVRRGRASSVLERFPLDVDHHS